MHAAAPHSVHRTLVIRFGALGDLVLATALLPGLRRQRPSTHVTWVTKEIWAPLLAHDPRIDALITLGPGESLRSLRSRLDDHGFDRVIDAHSNLRSRLLTAQLPPAPTVRLHKDTFARWLLVAGGPQLASLDRRLVDRFRALVPASRPTDRPRIVVGTRPRARASVAMEDDGPWLAVAPGAKHPAKRWPAERFAAVARAHADRHGARVLVLGGPDDRAEMRVVESAVPGAVVWPADGPLDEVAAALERCALLLANDSGLVHLAEAVGTPVVAVFGPTVRAWGYFPLDPRSRVVEKDVACRPCSKAGERPCRQPETWCLTRSTVDEVTSVVEDAWSANASDRRFR